MIGKREKNLVKVFHGRSFEKSLRFEIPNSVKKSAGDNNDDPET
jgi:hypothetical protein